MHKLCKVDIENKYPLETEKIIKEHLNYISEMAEIFNTTPKDIENLENKISAAEGTIKSINRASSAAIGYGAGKKLACRNIS